MSNDKAAAPRPVCFMVMPFGEKATRTPNAPDKVDFTHLWHAALKPAIEACDYKAVRADEDMGTVIIKDMIERLVASDLIVADVSIANANVYYELGLRHAACETGCVMVAADWAEPVFDIKQFTRFTYPVPQKKVSDEQAKKIQDCIRTSLPEAAREKSPVYREVPGFPEPDREKLDAFREHIDATYDFQTEVRRIQLIREDEKRAEECNKLVDNTLQSKVVLPWVASDLLELVRGDGNWKEVLEFIDRLPDDIQRRPFIVEQQALALSKYGDHATSIAKLENLIRRSGASPERLGLLGGRYKRLYDESGKREHLNSSIDAYEKGMRLDLNAYYPGCNLPLLLRERGDSGDRERSVTVNHIVIEACESARENGTADEWVNPTLLVAAFVTGEVEKAKELATLVKREGAAKWELESALADMKRALDQLKEREGKAELNLIYDDLAALFPAKTE